MKLTPAEHVHPMTNDPVLSVVADGRFEIKDRGPVYTTYMPDAATRLSYRSVVGHTVQITYRDATFRALCVGVERFYTGEEFFRPKEPVGLLIRESTVEAAP